jgi:hypothetical protein
MIEVPQNGRRSSAALGLHPKLARPPNENALQGDRKLKNIAPEFAGRLWENLGGK